MKYITRLFIHGLLVLIPIIATFYIGLWLINSFESLFKSTLLFLLPGHYFRKYYFPGMGTIGGVVLIFITGILMQNWGMRKVYQYGERLIEKFPVFGDIYSTLKSLLQYFTGSIKKGSEQVVILEYKGTKLLGIVTRENFDDVPSGLGGTDVIAVYLPMSYQLGGYTIYINKKYVTPIDMTKKEALQWILTAGLGSKNENNEEREIKKNKTR